jgi:hypothetical protein
MANWFSENNPENQEKKSWFLDNAPVLKSNESEIKPMTLMDKISNSTQELSTIPRAFMNTASFGGLDSVDSVGKFLNKKIGLPYQVSPKNPNTFPGKIGAGVASIAGSFEGPGRLAGAVGRRILPTMAKNAGIIGNFARTLASMGEGATFGASMPGSLQDREKTAMMGSVFQPAIKAGIEGLEPAAIRISKNIIRPTGKYASRSEKIAKTALKYGTLRSTAGDTAERSKEIIEKKLNEVDSLAENANANISMRPAFKRAAAAARYWINEGKPDRAKSILSEIQTLANAKGINANTSLPAKRFLNLRRSGDVALKKLKPEGGFFSTVLPPDIEARQEFLGGMRRSFGQAIPEAGSKNKEISELIDLANASSNRSNVSSRNDLMGLTDWVMLAGGKEKLFMLKKLLQGGRSLGARGMYNAAQFIKSLERNPSALTGENINETIPNQLNSMEPRKLLPAPKKPITTAIPMPEFKNQIGTSKLIEKTPIIFGEKPSIQKTSMLKKFGINPFTGKLKKSKIPSQYQAALKRFIKSKEKG